MFGGRYDKDVFIRAGRKANSRSSGEIVRRLCWFALSQLPINRRSFLDMEKSRLR